MAVADSSKTIGPKSTLPHSGWRFNYDGCDLKSNPLLGTVGYFLKNKLSESSEQKKSKPLWRYIKSKRQDGNGVSPLKENGQLHSDSRRKAEILNHQFCPIFTSENTTNIPKLPGSPNTELRRKGIRTGQAPELDSEECCQRNISLS